MRALTTPGQLHAFDNDTGLAVAALGVIIGVMALIIVGRLAWEHAQAKGWV